MSSRSRDLGGDPWRSLSFADNLLSAYVDVDADHGAVHDNPARAERTTGREAGGVAGRHRVERGREVGLADVHARRDRVRRPCPEVDVPHRAVVELAVLLEDLLQDV